MKVNFHQYLYNNNVFILLILSEQYKQVLDIGMQ